jgi:hypothetical protein
VKSSKTTSQTEADENQKLTTVGAKMTRHATQSVKMTFSVQTHPPSSENLNCEYA